MLKKTLFSTVSLVALALSGTAGAQVSTGEQAEDEAIEEIMVTGTRADLASAVNSKRSSDVITDDIWSNDIGSLPDLNIGDSLQRVPGVQVQRNARGQTADISIRGLPSRFSQIVYNGRPVLASYGDDLGGRNFAAYIVPSSFVRKLGVAKTSRADIVEGGIAGTIDVVSRTAFDARDTFTFDARAIHESNSEDISEDFSAVFSKLFANETIGFLAGVSYVNELPETHRTRGGNYDISLDEVDPTRDLNGDGDFVDEDIIVRRNTVVELFDSERERIAFTSNLDYRPSDQFRLFADLLYVEQETDNAVAAFIIDQRRNPDTNGSLQETIDVNGAEIVSQLSTLGSRNDARGEWQLRENDLLVGQLSATWTPGQWEIGVKAGASKSEHNQDRYRAQSRGPSVPVTVNFNSDDQPPAFNIDDASLALLRDSSLYNLNNLTSAGSGTDINHTIETNDLYLDFRRDLDHDLLSYVKFGGSFTDNEFDSRRARFNLNSGELGAIGVTEYPVIPFEPGGGSYLDSASVFVPVPLGVDVVNVISDLAASGIGVPELIAADGGGIAAADNANELIAIDEQLTTAYFMVGFGDEDSAFSGNVGLRYLHTDEVRGGATIDLNAGFIREADGETLRPVSEGTPTTLDRTYDEWLPSLNLSYVIGDDHVIRFGAAKVIRRPDPQNLDLVVSGLNGGDVENPNRLRVDDPGIEPYLSNNFDLAWSWYFGEQSLVSLAYFYKDLDSLIDDKDILLNFDVTDEVTGATNSEEFEVRTTTNDEGVRLKGVEVQYQQPFTFLPGFWSNFGTQVNYTYINNSAPDRLQAAAEDNYNIVVYYDDGRFDARLSFTYRGEYLGEPGNAPNPDEYFAPTEYLVGRVSYKISDRFEIFANGANMTNDALNRYREGPLVRQYADFGVRYSIGLRGRFE